MREVLFEEKHEESEGEAQYLRELLKDFMKFCDGGGWVKTEYTDEIIDEYVSSKQ